MKVVLYDSQGYEEGRVDADDGRALNEWEVPKLVAFFKDHPYVRATHRDQGDEVAYCKASYFVIEATSDSGVYLLDGELQGDDPDPSAP